MDLQDINKKSKVMFYNATHILFFQKIFKVSEKHVKKVIRGNSIDTTEFYNFLTSDDNLNRDKFYSFFKSEDTADNWWTIFIDDYYLAEQVDE